jgi:hypothetical protein
MEAGPDGEQRRGERAARVARLRPRDHGAELRDPDQVDSPVGEDAAVLVRVRPVERVNPEALDERPQRRGRKVGAIALACRRRDSTTRSLTAEAG